MTEVTFDRVRDVVSEVFLDLTGDILEDGNLGSQLEAMAARSGVSSEMLSQEISDSIKVKLGVSYVLLENMTPEQLYTELLILCKEKEYVH